MNRYKTYKDSGIPWLGEVPEHWETWKITHTIDLIGSGTTPKSDNAEYYDGDVLWVTTSELRENFISDTKQKVSDRAIKDYSALKIYPVNSVAMAMYGATIGRLGILEKEATFNQACCVFGVSKILYYKFLFYWLWHRRPILISLSNGGGQPNLSQDDLKKLKLPIPSYKEQIFIAHYLDTKLGEIDALIGKQQTLLEKLAEQRTAVITHAVTKGLNPAAPMKNSGVEWLGDVPAHWEMKAIKRVVKEHAGNGFPIELQGNNGDVPFLKVSDLNKGGKLLEDFANSVTRNIIYEMKWNIVPKFSLVTAKIGEALKKNHRKIISQDSIIDNNCIAFECLGINLDYHYYLSLIIDFDWFENGGTVPSLSVQKYKNQKICIPSLEEQTAIAEYLDQETAKIDRLCDTVNQTIGRLKEYRTALITQAVTGKIKVTDE